MARSQTSAFVLRTVDYGENHVIVHLLGRQSGRISAIAYGARSSRRRFSGCLEPLRVVEATVRPPKSGDLYRLDEMDVTEDFPGIEERLETLTAAGYATELTRETWREGAVADRIFDLLLQFHRHLPNCSTEAAVTRLIHQFEYRLLDLYGLAPAIHHCGRCGAAPESMEKLRFSRGGEGLICPKCRRRDDTVGIITTETLQLLHHLADPDCPLPDAELDAPLAQAGRVLQNAVDHLIDRPLNSRQMLRLLL